MMQPLLLKSVTGEIGLLSRQSSPKTDKRIMSAEIAQSLKSMMIDVVKSGTGKRAAIKGVKVGGKTGTAEVGGGKAPHAWFVGMVEDAEHPLAVCVFIENGGHGGTAAAPIAKKLLAKAIDLGY